MALYLTLEHLKVLHATLLKVAFFLIKQLSKRFFPIIFFP